jgi:hypothetical protein
VICPREYGNNDGEKLLIAKIAEKFPKYTKKIKLFLATLAQP